MSSVDTAFYVLKPLASEAQLRMAPDQYDDSYAEAIWSDESFTFETTTCAAEPLHARARRCEGGTMSAEWGDGRRGDVAWTFWGDLLINSRVSDLLREAGVTGYSSRAVRVGSDEMHWLRATGWGGMASAGSKIYRAYHCEACGHVHYKVRTWPERVVEVGRWDGSGVFMVWPTPMYLFVTGRVAGLLARAGVRGVGCYPEAYAVRRSDTFSPGRLSYYMGAEVARARGRDADIVEV